MKHLTARLCACALGVFFIAGCASPKAKPSQPAPEAAPTHAALTVGGRVHAVLGRALVIAIDPPKEGQVEARLDDGRLLLSRPARLFARPPADADPWLGPIARWESETPATDPAVAAAQGGAWVCVVDPPVDAAGHDILINGERIFLHWLPPASTLPRTDGEGLPDAWTPTRPERMPAASIHVRRFADESRSPFTRWRYRLLTEGLHPDAPTFPPFGDPVTEALAQQEEDRWRVGLAWLWGADPELASRVKRRLSAVMEFAPGQWAPAWSCDTDSLRRLLDDLLNPSLSPTRRAAQAQRWLDERPQLAAWVVDDGGEIDPTTRSIRPTIAMASLLDRATLAWASWGTASTDRTPDLQPMPPMTVRDFTLAPQGIDAPPARGVVAHVGRDTVSLATLARPIGVRPPGLALRPFAADWSMDACLLSTIAPPDTTWETAALLHKRPALPATADAAPRAAGWEVLVECKSADTIADERVDLYLGPMGKPAALVRAWRDGRIENIVPLPGADATDAPTVIRSADRWSVRFSLPASCVEPANLLRIGLARTDARGVRSAVPRAMMPWQDEPARVAVDLSTWEK